MKKIKKKYPCIICKKLLTTRYKECCDTCVKNYVNPKNDFNTIMVKKAAKLIKKEIASVEHFIETGHVNGELYGRILKIMIQFAKEWHIGIINHINDNQ